MSTFNDDMIKEIDTLYKRIGKQTYHNATVPVLRLSDNDLNDMEVYLTRCEKITNHLESEGYSYDWFKGWVK